MIIRFLPILVQVFLLINRISSETEIDYVNSLLNEDICTESCLAPEVYLKAYGFMKNSKAFKNYTLLDSIKHVNGLEHWKAPRELQEKFPYYLSGYDYDDQPVWVAETGKFNVKKIVEQGSAAVEELKLYLFQAVFRMLKSMQVKDTATKEVRGVFLLGDWEGLDITQVTHVPTVLFVIDMIRTYLDFLLVGVSHVIAINMGYAAETALQLVRPVLGGVLQNIELYGTNKAKWTAALRRALPLEAIPSWYGGKADFKPLQVYG